MKKIMISFTMLLSTLSAYGSQETLNCNSSRSGSFRMNIERLAHRGCHSGIITYSSTASFRYNVEVCDGVDATGFIEVLDLNGDWIATEKFSTTVNCTITGFRRISTVSSSNGGRISTNYTCPRRGRYRHSERCD